MTTRDEEMEARAERLVDEALKTPPTTYTCECGDPWCIFATATSREAT